MERKGFLFMSAFKMRRSLGLIGCIVGTIGTLLVLSGFSSASATEVLDKINLSSKISSLGGYIRSVRVEDISRDGKVVVGRYRPQTEPHDWQWFRYTIEGGMEDLKTLGKPSIDAMHLSADGSIIVGTFYIKGEGNHTFCLTQSKGFEDLGTLGQKSVAVHAISADGSVFVGGFIFSDQPVRYHAFRYSEADGFEDLGTMGAESAFARGVSADGSVIVGNFHVANSRDHAFRYSKGRGIQDLGVPGKVAAFARGISDDGSVIVGDFFGSFNFHDFNYYSHIFVNRAQAGTEKLGAMDGKTAHVCAIAPDGTKFYGSYIDSAGEAYAFVAKIGASEGGSMTGLFGEWMRKVPKLVQ
jgi:probable HAF family extracellular repeat protein